MESIPNYHKSTAPIRERKKKVEQFKKANANDTFALEPKQQQTVNIN